MGASAGGLKALEDFFKAVPADSRLTFVVVQHLSPDFKSLMEDLLARYTELPIARIEDGMRIEPGHIYLIPPRQLLRLNANRCSLEKMDSPKRLDMPIDIFFQSLAKAYGPRAAAVILSGTGSDGSEGIVAVGEAGGFTLVQTPDSAEFDGMPRSALQAFQPDRLCAPGEMPFALEDRYVHSEERAGPGPAKKSSGPRHAAEGFGPVFDRLQGAFNLDFALYKDSTVSRRIHRRITFLGLETVEAYTKHLDEHPAELDILYRDLLIGVTEFFRDPHVFGALEEEILPDLLERTRGDLRVWVAGCASGEEAYSIAILLLDQAAQRDFRGRITIFATDVHPRSIEIASEGEFTEEALQHLSQERRERYFNRIAKDTYRILPEIRQRIVFARHNLLRDPPFTRIDLITCRNLLIYLEPQVQERVLTLFHYSLKPKGVLVLGTSEGVGRLGSQFQVEVGAQKIFRKIGHFQSGPAWKPGLVQRKTAQPELLAKPGGATPREYIDSRLVSAYDTLISRQNQAGMLITPEEEILHLFGSVRDYLLPEKGRVDQKLSRRLDEKLRIMVNTTLERARKTQSAVESRRLEVGRAAPDKTVDIRVEPIFSEDGELQLFFIRFTPSSVVLPKREETGDGTTGTDEDEAAFNLDEATRTRIVGLEQELQATRENLQATIEELQTSNEELQAANEEMLASNEELQSTNEELHSVNEELYSVNTEYERKNEELKRLNEDHTNLLNSIEVGTVFVDRDLCIRKFNPAIAQAFNLLPQDIGRPIDHIAYHLEGQSRMLDELREVIDHGQSFEEEVRTKDDRWLQKRVLPFYGSNRSTDGALLTFTDISEIKATQDRLNMAMESARLVWWEWDMQADLLETHSLGWCILGYRLESLQPSSRTWMDLVHPDDRERVQESLDAHLEEKTFDWRCEHRFKARSGEYRWVLNMGRVNRRDSDGRPLRMIGSTQEIDERKKAEISLERNRLFLNRTAELAHVGGWAVDLESFDVTWTDEVYRIHELPVGQVLNYETILGFFTAEGRRTFEAAVERCQRDQEPFDLHLVLVTNRDNQRFVRVLGEHRKTGRDQGQIVGFVQDITSQHRMLDQLMQEREKALAASRTKSEFLAMMSHELRTPLNPILGFADILMEAEEDENRRTYLSNIVESGEHLLHLISDILDISRIESGKLDLADNPFEPVEVIEKAIAPFLPRAEAKGLALELQLADELQDDKAPVLSGDANKLQQIISNLVSNAVKYTEEGSVTISSSLEGPDQEESMLVVEVSDTGRGISDSERDALFEPFSRGLRLNESQIEGAGLGLAICRRFVDAMKGSITLESEAGVGSRFILQLPFRKTGEPASVGERGTSDRSGEN
ncbi:MAG: CheR family methyltransferase [Opitutales bacterium]